jgi:hypothetical protein
MTSGVDHFGSISKSWKQQGLGTQHHSMAMLVILKLFFFFKVKANETEVKQLLLRA